MKYQRVKPEAVSIEAPRHRFISYCFGLDFNKPKTEKEFLDTWKEAYKVYSWANPWSPEQEEEALEALRWLVDQGLAKEVE